MNNAHLSYDEATAELVIRVPLAVAGRPAASGKSSILAGTPGQFEGLGKLNAALSGHSITMVVTRQNHAALAQPRRLTGSERYLRKLGLIEQAEGL